MDIQTLYNELLHKQFSLLENLRSNVIGDFVLENRVEIINPENFIEFFIGTDEWHLATKRGRKLNYETIIHAVEACSPNEFDRDTLLSVEAGLRLVWFRIKTTELDK